MVGKRIVLITDFTGYSGTKTYFLLLADYLLRKGYYLEVFLASHDSLTNQEYIEFKTRPITFHHLPKILLTNNSLLKRLRINKLLQFLFLFVFRLSSSVSRLFAFRLPSSVSRLFVSRLLSSVSLSSSLVIVSTGHPFSFLSGAWLWGKKFVYIQHTYPQGQPSKLTRLISPIRSVWFYLMAKRCFSFITVSEASKKLILDLANLSDKKFPIRVLYTPCRFIKPIQNSSNGPVVLTIGQLEKWKNPNFWVEVAISVARQNSEVSFIWEGTGSMMDGIRKRIPEDLKERIQLIGFHENLMELFSKAAIYFQPSLVESQGLSVVEAMAHSLPCVVSNRGGLPEMVDHGNTGFVVELDPKLAVNRLLYLLGNPDVTRKMGLAGYERYRQNFTPEIWERNMDRLLFEPAKA
jgi:glycosyltransferase involved in cell wall biosynthesis